MQLPPVMPAPETRPPPPNCPAPNCPPPRPRLICAATADTLTRSKAIVKTRLVIPLAVYNETRRLSPPGPCVFTSFKKLKHVLQSELHDSRITCCRDRAEPCSVHR